MSNNIFKCLYKHQVVSMLKFFGAVHLGTDVKFGYFRFPDLKKISGENRTRVIRNESVFNHMMIFGL